MGRIIALTGVVVLVLAASTHAWGPEPVVVEATNFLGNHYYYKVISDGKGGVFVAWAGSSDEPAGAQRISRQGELLWGPDGIPLFEGRREYMCIGEVVSNEAGGVVIVGGSVYEESNFAQRLGPDGRKYWDVGGVELGIDGRVSAVPDGTGGVIVASVAGDKLYMQRVNGRGKVLWGAHGIELASGVGGRPRLISDGKGGAIGIAGGKIWKVGSDGKLAWGGFELKEGVQLPEPLPKPIFRLEGGYVKKLSPNLEPVWGQGVQLWEADKMNWVATAEDGAGGLFIAWWDQDPFENPYGKRVDGYVQHIGFQGRELWGSPVKFAARILEPGKLSLTPDGKGGIFIGFEEEWYYGYSRDVNMYLQHVDSRGYTWSTGPIKLGKANSSNRPYLVGDGQGGVIVVWPWEGRIYLQHVSAEGEVGANYTSVKTGMMEVPEEFRLGQNIPNPFNSLTLIPYSVPEGRQYSLKIYNSLGQKVRTLVEGRKCWGRQIAVWDGKDEKGRDVTSGVYVYELRAGRFKKTRKMILAR